MAWLWSNPEPGGRTLPELQSQFKVESPNIGALISAIMEQKARAEKQSRDDMNSLISGVGSVAGGVASGYQHQGQEDTARAAQYFSQNPQAYDDYLQSGQLPAGITRGSNLDDVMLQKMMSGQGAPQFYTDPGTGGSVYKWGGRTGTVTNAMTGGATPAQELARERENRIALGSQITEKEQELRAMGFTDEQLASPKNKAGERIGEEFIGEGGMATDYFGADKGRIAKGPLMQVYQGADKKTGADLPAKEVDAQTFARAKELSAELAELRKQLATGQYKSAAGLGGGILGTGSQSTRGAGANDPNAVRAEALQAIRQRPDKEAEIRARFRDITGEEL